MSARHQFPPVGSALLTVAAAFIALSGSPAAASVALDPPNPPVAVLHAGVARIDITPEAPIALHGYENPENRISDGVHDRLYARAVAFASGPHRLVLVSADLASFQFGPYFQHIIAKRLGLRPEEVLLCATHTHSGPQLSLNKDYPHPANAPYTEALTGKLVTVVDRALRSLAPVRIRVGHGTSRVGVSRRLIHPDGRVEMAPNPAGVSDPEVVAIGVERPGGGLLAVLFSYACHSRSLRSPNRLISGDVLGIAEQHVERRLGRNVLAAAFAGTSGDIDPERVVDGFLSPEGTLPDTVRMGQSLGDSVVEAVNSAAALDLAPLRVAVADIPLPGKHVGVRPVRVVTAAVGDLGLATLECEASAQVGLMVKAASPFKHTFVASLCHAWGGYLPVASQYPEGGYEVARSAYAPGAAETLVQAIVEMLRRLR